MSVLFDAGSILIETTDSGDKDFSVNNFSGESPKAVIFFPSQQDADGSADDARWGMGVMTATKNYFMGARAKDDISSPAASDTARMQTGEKCVAAINSTSNVIAWNAKGGTTPFAADKFTLDVVNAPANDRRVGYLAIGGDDVEVDVGSFALTTGASQTISTVPFQADALILMMVRDISAIESATNFTNDIRLSIGFSDGTTNFNSIAVSDHNATPTLAQHSIRSDGILGMLSMAGSIQGSSSLNSFISNGFVLDHDTTWSAAYKVVYIAIKGARFKTGSFTQQTSTGEFSVTNVGFRPSATMLLHAGNILTLDTIKLDAVMYGGFARDASSQWASGFTDDGAADPTVSKTYNDDDLIMIRYPAATGSLIAEIRFVSNDADGITMNQIDANNNEHQIIFLMMEGVEPPASPTSPWSGWGGTTWNRWVSRKGWGP